jgi:D-amino-acid dehydrogenase
MRSGNAIMSRILVVGGGIVGASAAYALARRGVDVTLVDRADEGQATAAGAGIISPGTSFKSPAAFFPLAFRSGAYYQELLAALAEDGERDTGYEVVGLLHVAMTDDEVAWLDELLRLFRGRVAEGVPNLGTVEVLNADQARGHFPALSPEVRGAIYTSGGARVDGRRLRDALLCAAQRRGATIVRGEASPQLEAGRLTGMHVADLTYTAEAVLLAGGAWSADFAAPLGMSLPVYPQRGQILHLDLPNTVTATWPIVVGFHSHYLLTFPTARVVAGATRENDAGFDVRATAAGVREALGEALRMAPGLAQATLREVRVGLRPASPDGLPLLGRLPGAENVYIATGMGASGLQLGPYCGALVSDLALGAAPPFDLTPYAPERFPQDSR